MTNLLIFFRIFHKSESVLCRELLCVTFEQSSHVEHDFVADIQKLVGDMPDGADGVNTSHDHDRDKYKRRPALQWLTRWFRYIAVFLSDKRFSLHQR